MKERDLKDRLENSQFYYDLVCKSGKKALTKSSKDYTLTHLDKELIKLYELDCIQPEWVLSYYPRLWNLIAKLEHLKDELPCEFLIVDNSKELAKRTENILSFYLKLKD